VIPEAKPARALGTAGLVFGILSVFPLGALAGVPAVVLSAFALRGEPRSRGRATAGVVLGSFGVLVTVGLMLVFASVSNRSGLARPDASGSGVVSNGKYLVQGSLEEWAADSGAYPAPTDFDSDSSRFMRFLARDRVG